MNQHTALRQVKAPRPRPFWKPPRKPNGRLDKPQVEGNVEEANPNLRSITGNRSLIEIGTQVPSDQRNVTVPPQSPSPLEKGAPKTDKEPSKPKIPTATGYGPRATASSTATCKESRQRQQEDNRPVNNDPFMIEGFRPKHHKDGKEDQAKNERKKGLLEKDPIGDGLIKQPHGTGSSVYLMDSKATPINSKKDEIKEEVSSKQAAMLKRAIDSSDVT